MRLSTEDGLHGHSRHVVPYPASADTAHQAGISGMGMYATNLYYGTAESQEGVNAFKEKRKPNFRQFVN